MGQEGIKYAIVGASATCISIVLLLIIAHHYTTPDTNVVVFLAALVAAFVSGSILNAAAGKAIFGIVGGCLGLVYGLVIGAALFSLSNDPLSGWRKYEMITSEPDIDFVHICDSASWQNSKAGMYFQDGALTRHGQLPNETSIDVPHCNYVYGRANNGYWTPCAFHVRPLFQCDSSDGFCASSRQCAWAFARDASSSLPKRVSCGKEAILCGLSVDITIIATGIDENASLALNEFNNGLKEAAGNAGMQFEKGLPLIELGNPDKMKADLHKYVWLWWAYAAAYTGLPLVVGCFFALTGRKPQWDYFPQFSEGRETQEIFTAEKHARCKTHGAYVMLE